MYQDTLVSGFVNISVYFNKLANNFKPLDRFFKNWLCPNFSRCPKNLSCPKFGGAVAPLAPPARTPMCIMNCDIVLIVYS